MTSNSAVGEHRRDGGPARIQATDLEEVLHGAVREALFRMDAVSAAVYLLHGDDAELHAAMIAGSPPSCFTMPCTIDIDMPRASSRAVATGRTAVLPDPDPAGADQTYALPYPYAALAAPVTADGHRFGALTVLRLESHGDYGPADHKVLREIADTLAAALAGLARHGTTVRAGPTPAVVPVLHSSVHTPGWGVRGVPGSAGASLMYPLRHLAERLNQATTMDHVIAAARDSIMTPLGARVLVLASVSAGRLWVLGHSGPSSAMVRTLHGARLGARTPAAEAVGGHALFLSGGPPRDEGSEWEDAGPRAAAYLPLAIGSRLVAEAPARNTHVVGVCCLEFAGPREFPPEERTVLGMMAGMLGATVERVELDARQREVAEHLQRRLLPSALAEVPGLATTARYRPAVTTVQVGGDWYDVIKVADDRMVLVVGDVEGHDLDSAAVMGQARTALISYATEGHCPAVVIDRTDRLLAELGTEQLVTCCVVALDTGDGTAEVALAGHPAPIVRRPDGSVDVLEAPPNLPLGVTAGHPYRSWEHTLSPGSVLMLYSNGLTDSATRDPGTCAQDLLHKGGRQAGTDLERLADRLVAQVSGPRWRRDDAVLLLARYEGAVGKGAPRTASLHVQRRDLHGVKATRAFVDEQLRSWSLAGMSDALQLIASEVVTNALIHAGSDVDVRLRAFDDRVRLEVRDSCGNPPVPSPLALDEEENAEAEHGRGLLIVEALAGQWNTSPNGRGKTVSLDLPIPTEA
ncbi:SpoIIE family protein phosphatase [Actinacidiphila sp. bgisy160]|uniref:SpoIIE family protein phosphatase n=1 Tax=Actinacidiphila sp. bgisy160 TaxID=3413796 RepID=UPI003D709825